MTTRFDRQVLALVAMVCLTAAVAHGQNANPNPPIQQVSGVDYSVVQGTAYASDTEQPTGIAFAIDPSWIMHPGDVVQQSKPQTTHLVAQESGPGMPSDGPPVPPPDKSDDKAGTESSSSSSSPSSSSSTCESCGENQCDNSCDDSCHHCHCTDPIQYCGGPIQFLDHCWPMDCCDDPVHVLDCCWSENNGVGVYGWIDGGIMGNDHAPRSHFNGPVTFPDRDDGQLNQFYGVVERTASCDNCGWFLGGRADLYWGSDYFFTTAAGLDGRPVGNVARWNSTDSFQYGWSMPQLYAEIDYNDIKVKAGHFYSPIGYEVAPAVGNFFYTHSYARQYGEPFTNTGILASQPLNDNWTWYAGIDNGWNAFDCDSRANFLGGLSYHDDCWGSLAFMIQTGDDSTFDTTTSGIGPFANRTTYSLVWQRDFSSRLTYVLEHNLGIQQDADALQGIDTAEWYGLTNYLFYKINCCWQVGARFEWFRDDDGFAVTGLRPGNPLAGNFFAGNFYETSIGLNWKPNSNVTVRPEVRWDWFNPTSGAGSQNPFNDDRSKNQFLFGLDAIVQF